MLKAKMIATGSALPPYEWDNEKIEKIIKAKYPDAPDKEWVKQVFGIDSRRKSLNYETNTVYEGCSDTELAVTAARNALEMAEMKGSDLDLIIHTTFSPDFCTEPDPVIQIHEALEGKLACGYATVPSTCTGLTNSINIANGLISGGMVKNALLTAACAYSAYINQDMYPMYFVGDGASAVIMAATDENDESGFVDFYWGIRHEPAGFFNPKSGVAQFSMPEKMIETELDSAFFVENVATYAVNNVTDTLKGIINKHPGITNEIDWVLAHQANIALRYFLSKKLEIPIEKIPFNIDHVGNTFAASTGILLDECVRDGRIKRGDLILAIAVGTGWTQAAYLMRW